jgi:hypothetical protein
MSEPATFFSVRPVAVRTACRQLVRIDELGLVGESGGVGVRGGVTLGFDPSSGPTVSVPAPAASDVTTEIIGSATAYCSMRG